MTDLWLIRHRQTDWNLQGRWQRQALNAAGLNDTGYAQTLAVLKHLTGKNVAGINTAPGSVEI